MFFLDFRREITEKVLKLTKKVENGPKQAVNLSSFSFIYSSLGTFINDVTEVAKTDSGQGMI